MYRLIRRLLFLFPAEAAHRLGMLVLRLMGRSPALCRRLRRRATSIDLDLSIRLAGLTFPNPVGLAAGLDKNAEATAGLFALGFGAVEVGTFTPQPQDGNPRPRLFRLTEHRALINRMGFNNRGAEEAAARLARLAWRPAPLGTNIGKNRQTPLDRAVDDYVRCAEILGPVSDYVVLNASSPNTPGLRTLQDPDPLAQLLVAVRLNLARFGKPLFLKVSPDLAPESVDQLVDTAMRCRVDGLIATNTTVERPVQHRLAREEGGLSGAPLRPIANQVIRRAYLRTQGRLPVIGVGGVFTAEDVYEKLQAGASLVQIYTGLIYEGPGLIRQILRRLAQLLQRDGHRSPSEAVGAAHRNPL